MDRQEQERRRGRRGRRRRRRGQSLKQPNDELEGEVVQCQGYIGARASVIEPSHACSQVSSYKLPGLCSESDYMHPAMAMRSMRRGDYVSLLLLLLLLLFLPSIRTSNHTGVLYARDSYTQSSLTWEGRGRLH